MTGVSMLNSLTRRMGRRKPPFTKLMRRMKSDLITHNGTGLAFPQQTLR